MEVTQSPTLGVMFQLNTASVLSPENHERGPTGRDAQTERRGTREAAVLLPPASRRGQIKIATKGNKCQHTLRGYIAFSNSDWRNAPAPIPPGRRVRSESGGRNLCGSAESLKWMQFLLRLRVAWFTFTGRGGGADSVYRPAASLFISGPHFLAACAPRAA